MRGLSLLPFLFMCVQSYHTPTPARLPSAEALTFINPTGTYTLKGGVKKNNITGHFGELRVRLLDSQTVAFCFYLNSGYPDYAAAAILDTLRYEDNSIHYRPGRDSTCFLILTFSARSVEMMKVYSDPATGCGFAPGIIVPATLQKTSSEIPVIQDLSTRERLTP
jgi:hypothetical protein